MRDFFIKTTEKLITVLVVLLLLVVVVMAGMMLFQPQGGLIPALVVLALGGIYSIVVGGMLYLFFGIYRNTLETNRLLKELLKK